MEERGNNVIMLLVIVPRSLAEQDVSDRKGAERVSIEVDKKHRKTDVVDGDLVVGGTVLAAQKDTIVGIGRKQEIYLRHKFLFKKKRIVISWNFFLYNLPKIKLSIHYCSPNR